MFPKLLKILLVRLGTFFFLTVAVVAADDALPSKDQSQEKLVSLIDNEQIDVPIYDVLSFEESRWELSGLKEAVSLLNASSARVGDFSGDGKADLLLLDQSSRRLTLASSNGAGKFIELEAGLLPDAARWSLGVMGDLNTDSRQDLVFPEADGENWWIGYSEAGGTFRFERQLIFPKGFPPERVFLVRSTPSHEWHLVSIKPLLFALAVAHKPGTFEILFGNAVPEYLSIQAIANVNADDFADPMYFSQGFENRLQSYCADLRFACREPRVTWAEFPPTLKIGRIFSGPFDKNPGDDILVQGNPLLGWWIARSMIKASVELPVAGLPRRVPSSDVLGNGDTDGDGLSDMVIVVDGQLKVFKAVLTQIPGLQKGEGPYTCQAYYPHADENSVKWGSRVGACAQEHAVYSVDDGSGGVSVQDRWLNSPCCRLPNSDILTDEHVEAEAVCPDGYVATGVKINPSCNGCPLPLHCTRINSKRYQLGPETSGVYWGLGASINLPRDSLNRLDLPLAIRYSVGRQGYSNWDMDGCIGKPVGSLLVSKSGSFCKQAKFRELQYGGAPGDPPAGTPVTMFPSCISGLNPFDPLGRCLTSDPQPEEKTKN